MKRMLRVLFNSATALSFLLFIASAALWVRSYFISDWLHWYGDGRELSLISSRGEFDWYRVWARDLTQPTEFKWHQQANSKGLSSRIKSLERNSELWRVGPILGFAYFIDRHPRYADLFMEVMVPWWAIVLATLVWPFMFYRRLKARRPRSPTACKICGYDLRATPERCPECGTMVAAPPDIGGG